MLRIVDGKRYNTVTATWICSCGSAGGVSRSDFRYEETDLYRAPRGGWFLAGKGGPMSRWAHYNGNMYGSGSGIQPLDDDEARELLEQHGETDALEKYFASAIVDA